MTVKYILNPFIKKWLPGVDSHIFLISLADYSNMNSGNLLNFAGSVRRMLDYEYLMTVRC
jgi:hypothetical protein